MNKATISLGVAIGLALSTTAMAADYDSFLSPSSLSKNVKTLSSTYKLGLKKQSWGGYGNSEASDCGLSVDVNKRDQVTRIQISANSEKCRYKTAASGITFNSKTTKGVDILNQVKLENIKFIPGCFNCPSSIELADSLVINRAQDNYYTKFEIEGYNDEYLKFMGEKLFGKFSQDNYYPIMDKLEAKLRSDASPYDRKDFKLKAIQSYDLQQQPWNITIGLK